MSQASTVNSPRKNRISNVYRFSLPLRLAKKNFLSFESALNKKVSFNYIKVRIVIVYWRMIIHELVKKKQCETDWISDGYPTSVGLLQIRLN